MTPRACDGYMSLDHTPLAPDNRHFREGLFFLTDLELDHELRHSALAHGLLTRVSWEKKGLPFRAAVNYPSPDHRPQYP
jgi:hypothetical protein